MQGVLRWPFGVGLAVTTAVRSRVERVRDGVETIAGRKSRSDERDAKGAAEVFRSAVMNQEEP